MVGSNKKNANIGKFITIVSIIAIFVILFKVFNVTKYLSLDYIKEHQELFQNYYSNNPLITPLMFVIVYILVTALSIPGASILTLLAGALFGFFTGTIIVSISSTIGATLAFLVARFLLREKIQNSFSKNLKAFNEGVERDGAFYLFTMRLIPIFPFFVINLVMGLTTIKIIPYFFVSMLGMLPGTLVYVNAGVQLSEIQSLSDLMSIKLIASFVLLGLFPLIIKKVLNKFKRSDVQQKDTIT